MKDSIKLTIPCKAEYISVVRLTASSIASNIGMNIEDIEDIKVSIAEACINAMVDKEMLDISFNIYKNRLSIYVDNVEEHREKTSNSTNKQDGLGMLIIKSLMDEVYFTDKGVEMTKYIEDVLV